jgi:uncharacterized membrane protein YhaH (DUF805 family)
MFKNTFSFKGRIRRMEYGLSLLIFTPLYYLAIFLMLDESTMIFGSALMLPLFWFALAQGAKRCHDRGNSGFFQLIPFYGFWMLFADGERQTNEYGPDPKAAPGEYTETAVAREY